MVMRQYHASVGHPGTSNTWAEERQRYWIVKGGAAVRRSIRKCVLCKKQNAVMCKQSIADLSIARLQINHAPFYSVDIDFCGRFLIKQARHLVKRYICLFACLTTRAVHIEVAHPLSTDSILCALRRFILRRGNPKEIYSDNGIKFVGAVCILRESLWELNLEKIN